MGIKNIIKNMSSIFLSFLRTKTLIRLQNTVLWRQIIILPKTSILCVYELVTQKTQKCMQSNLYEEMKRCFQKRVFLSVQTLNRYKAWKSLDLNKKRTLRKTCLLSVFELITYQKPKPHAKKKQKNKIFMEQHNNITKNL